MAGSRHFSGLEADLSHTVPEIVAHAARCHGDRPFCIGEDGAITTFAGLAARTASFGAHLLRLGVGSGDRVAVLAPNSVEWVIAATATMSIGAILVPVSTRFKGLEIRHVLEKSRAAAICTVGEFLGARFPEMIVAACGGPGPGRPAADLPALVAIIGIDQPGFAPEAIPEADRAAFAAASAAVRPESTSDILFTSGTTGKPKGAMHSHAQGLWMTADWNATNEITERDRMAVVNPFFHSFGYRAGWVSALTAGATMYPVSVFDAGRMLELIERERITHLAGAPTVFQAMMTHPDFTRRDRSSLRSGYTGGAKTPPAIIRAGTEVFGFELFLAGFGLTESTAMASHHQRGDPVEAVIETVGHVRPGIECRFIDPDGNPLPPGAKGELLLRGPNVMQGYFDEPEATAAAIDAEGWLHTGDVGLIDADGLLRIIDRIKDIVIVGGFNAYPLEIEIMLGEHPAIAEVAVIGLPDARLGEVTAACVVLKPGASLTIEELTPWARERMANFKVPRALFVMAELPRTPLGKVRKFALRELVEPTSSPEPLP